MVRGVRLRPTADRKPEQQFKGRSTQKLKFFVVDLRTGALVQTIDTGITNAFAGSMINTVADFEIDYQDDAIYAGWTERTGSSGSYTWTKGGVGRILTKNSTPGAGVWTFGRVIENIGPVTASVARMQSRATARLAVLGTGGITTKFPTGPTTTPRSTSQRAAAALRDQGTVFTQNTRQHELHDNITFRPLPPSTVTDVADVPTASSRIRGFKGWFFDLDTSGTTPTTKHSRFNAPSGRSRPLATLRRGLLHHLSRTGTSARSAGRDSVGGRYTRRHASAAVMKGKALVQVSTASVSSSTCQPFREGRPQGRPEDRRVEGVRPSRRGWSCFRSRAREAHPSHDREVTTWRLTEMPRRHAGASPWWRSSSRSPCSRYC